jgi:hypothetical protein
MRRLLSARPPPAPEGFGDGHANGAASIELSRSSRFSVGVPENPSGSALVSLQPG